MTRQNALLRLHESLLAARERLGKRLANELAYLHDCNGADAGDSADVAFASDGDEVSSRLAEQDHRELSQVERALTRWEQGMFGQCAGGSVTCQKKIPVARLNALPYTSFCIHCERELEKQIDRFSLPSAVNWGQIFDPQELMQDRRVNVADLESEMAGSQRD